MNKLLTKKYKNKSGKPVKRSKKGKKTFLYNSNNPKSLSIFTNDNPKDTIPIKYKTVDDVKNTITKLEKLYKDRKYPHKRIWQVGMIMKVRLELLQDKKPEEYKIAKKYYEFLGQRTKLDENARYNYKFTYL